MAYIGTLKMRHFLKSFTFSDDMEWNGSDYCFTESCT